MAVTGRFAGNRALAAVGSTSALLNLMNGFFIGLSTGATVLLSQFYGAKSKQGVQDTLHTGVALSLVLGAVVMTLGYSLGPKILGLMNTPESCMDDAVLYIKIYFAGAIASMLYNMGAGILRAMGDSRRPTMFLMAACGVNIVLDILCVVVLKLGVAGAAIATDISQLVSCVLSLRFLIKSTDDCRVIPREIRLHKKMAARIIRVGLPTGIQNMVISLSNVLVQVSVNGYGAAAMAGFAAYMKVDGFNILPVLSFSMAATTFVGQNFGAGKLDRVKRSLWVTLAMSVGYTLFTGALLLVFRYPILHLFTQDDTVVEFGVAAMKYFCPFYFLLGIMHSLAGTIRGTGKTVPPMVVMLLALCLFRILWIQFVVPHFTSIDIIYVLYPVSWAVGMVLMLIYAWKGNWMPKKYQNINQTV